MGVSCKSSISLHGVIAMHWECLVIPLFVSMVSMVLIGSVLSIVYLSPWCQWYSFGVSCQSSIYLHGVNGTHWECIVNRLFISMVSMVLIGSVLSIVYLSQWCQWKSMGVSCQSFIELHGVIGTHLECLVNRLLNSMVSLVLIGSVLSFAYLSPWCHGYSLGVPCQSSIYLHDVTATHWECLVNRLFISMVSWLLIGSVLSNVIFSPWCQWYLSGVLH